jgi:ribonucleotide reductase beta subunit family protein with ferritin-like domain
MQEDETTMRIEPTLPEEPMLKNNPNRFVLFPIQYHDVW